MRIWSQNFVSIQPRTSLEKSHVSWPDIRIANELVHLTADHLRRVGRVFPVLLLELVDEDVLQLLALLDVHQALPPLVIELRVDLGDLYTESGQALQGSFSVESKPTFASKYSCESSRRDLHNTHLRTDTRFQNFKYNFFEL